jgi:GNAT superfamily N-acetyltransferase
MTLAQATTVRILAADLTNAPAVVALFDRELGRGLYEVADVLEADVSLVALAPDGTLLGAACALVKDGALCRASFEADQQDLAALLPFADEEPVGELEAIAVEPFARRQGIAALLVAERLRLLRKRGVVRFLAYAWTSERYGCHAGPALEASGLSPLVQVELFYERSSAETGFNCPLCVKGCLCACVIYAL